VGLRPSLDRCEKSHPHWNSVSETVGWLSCASTGNPLGSTTILIALILRSHGPAAAVVHYSAAASQIVGDISYSYIVSPAGNIDLLHLMNLTDLV
jgi:hypothetical protein